MSATVLSAEEESALSEALQSDPGFWTALIADPKAAYRTRFGKELSPGQEIRVEQEGPNRVNFVSGTGLRVSVEYGASGELRDDQLEAVAGGFGTPPDASDPAIIRLSPPRFTHY